MRGSCNQTCMMGEQIIQVADIAKWRMEPADYEVAEIAKWRMSALRKPAWYEDCGVGFRVAIQALGANVITPPPARTIIIKGA